MSASDKDVREYFERGCACIHLHGTMVALPPASVPDKEAAQHYLDNCQCNRNLKPEDYQ